MSKIDKNRILAMQKKALSASDLNLGKSLVTTANETFNKELSNVPQPPNVIPENTTQLASDSNKQEEPEANKTTSVFESDEISSDRVGEQLEKTFTQIETNTDDDKQTKKRKKIISFDELLSISANARVVYSSNNNAKLTDGNLAILKSIASNNKGVSVISLVNTILEESFKYYKDDIMEVERKKQEDMMKLFK